MALNEDLHSRISMMKILGSEVKEHEYQKILQKIMDPDGPEPESLESYLVSEDDEPIQVDLTDGYDGEWDLTIDPDFDEHD